MSEIRVAIAGVGNCASSLIQGIEYYRKNKREVVGLMHPDLGGYKLSDIKVVAAFDIDKRKVGQDLSKAVFAKPNNTTVFYPDVPHYGVAVKKGEVLDGVAKHMEEYPENQAFRVADEDPCNVLEELKKSGAEILVNYLPVGSEKGVKFYTQAALDAGVGFVNCMPVFIASDEKWAKRFEEKGLPIVGDDIKSQVGATIVHRVLTSLFRKRGVKLDRTYQLNIGGNTDFLNMISRDRLKSKKISKTESVQSQLDDPLPSENIHIGPSDYVPWLKDNKVCYIRMEGREFSDIPLTLELRLSVEDSPNNGGSAIDAIRCCKLGLDRGVGGPLTSISSYTMKHPPIQYSDDEARGKVED
ncbi:MAG: inositol-3-phosphate synthase, partial [Candidatus Aerophobetes bacterium]|nr:inositol-3-phosphate synthase [Candidatus Aerophobetes bacterium]